MFLTHVDWIPWLVATIAAYALGAIWYMPKVFGNAWLNALGKTKDRLGSPGKAMGITFITTAISAYVLAVLLTQLNMLTLSDAISASFIIGVAVYGLTTYSDALFNSQPMKMVAIQAGYRLSKFVLIGVIYSIFA